MFLFYMPIYWSSVQNGGAKIALILIADGDFINFCSKFPFLLFSCNFSNFWVDFGRGGQFWVILAFAGRTLDIGGLSLDSGRLIWWRLIWTGTGGRSIVLFFRIVILDQIHLWVEKSSDLPWARRTTYKPLEPWYIIGIRILFTFINW